MQGILQNYLCVHCFLAHVYECLIGEISVCISVDHNLIVYIDFAHKSQNFATH